MQPTSLTSKRRRGAALALAAALSATTALTFVPSTGFAEPPGGYADLVQKVAPSVVFIEVTEGPKQTLDNQQQQGQVPPNFPFQEFSRRFGFPFPFPDMPQGQQGPQGQMHGVGSGFVIDPSGLIVTNNHVVQNANSVKVKLSDGRAFDAKVLGTDPATDVALIKVDAPAALPAVPFGSSAKMRVGDDVMAVGNPFGLGGTVTTGIISAKARDIGNGNYDNFLQTDAAINKGNSGGPLFNDAGQVIGMNTAIISPTGGSVGIGFAVPSDLVQKIVTDLEHGGTVQRGWLGVQIQSVTPDIAAALGLDQPTGAMVAMVSPDSPAAKAGVKRGDIITAFGDTKIKTMHDLPRAVAMTAPDTSTKVSVLRAGKPLTLDVSVGALKPQKKA